MALMAGVGQVGVILDIAGVFGSIGHVNRSTAKFR